MAESINTTMSAAADAGSSYTADFHDDNTAMLSSPAGNRKGRRKFHYRGHFEQISIYLGKQLRGFVFRNDWKVLPMAAVIAALVSMVVRNDFFISMEGTLKGALALTCVSIWNGFFNSIQVICRERGIVKREHRSGMHVMAYIAAHMIYQALLCLTQSLLTLYVCRLSGVAFPREGLITGSMLADIGISMFLISYASDMLALFVSSIAHSTTAAMTVMPFLLIFQLVFSGGIFSLPSWADSFSGLTVSSYGLSCIAAQANYNALPMASGWSTVTKLEDETVSGTVTMGQLLDFAASDNMEQLISGFDLKDFDYSEIRDIIAAIAADPDLEKDREEELHYSFKVGDIINTIGREKVRTAIEQKSAAAAQTAAYEYSKINVAFYWISLILYAAVFALLSAVSLKFIDKDKR